jgi:colicin import membrane protein
MTARALIRDTLLPRSPGGAGRGIGLSVLVHAGLIVALAFGVSWRSRTPETQQAELWAEVPKAAAARAVEPEPPIEAVPVPTATVRPAPQVEAAPPAPVPDAQIAIEKARVEQARKEREAADQAREHERRKAEAERLAAAKAAAEKLRQQKEADASKKQQAAEAREAQQREADRKKNLERIRGMAGASGEPGATGSALQSAGPSASYAGRIVARVRPNIIFADDVAGNATAEVEVRAAADGTIIGRKLIKSSGIAAYDNAVLRAIDKTEVLPRDVDGRVPASMVLEFRPRD